MTAELKHASINRFTSILSEYLDDPDVTEICINREHEVWTLSDEWHYHAVNFPLDDIERMVTAIATWNKTYVDKDRPNFQGTLPTGPRVQAVLSPACENGTISITIRKPSKKIITMDEYSAMGFFIADGVDHREGIESAVATGKTIVVCGSTGSGKTTLLRTLLELIPHHLRVITLEDTYELPITHPNRVHLFTGKLGATAQLKVAFRSRPDRIVLGEIRGEEAYDFLKLVQSGHGGSMVTVHAKNCKAAFNQLALDIGESPKGGRLTDDRVQEMLHAAIDVVIHLSNEKRISEVWYKSD